MAVAYLASVGAQSSTGTDATTGAIDTTGANLLVMYVASDASQTVSDSKGNTWVALASHAGYSLPAAGIIYYCLNPTSVGSGHTFSVAGSGKPVIFAAAFSGAAGGKDLDGGGGCATGNSGVGGVSLTTSVAGELYITGVGISANTGNPTWDGTFSSLGGAIKTANAYGGGMAYRIVASSGTALNPFWFNINTASSAGVSNATFLPGAGGSGGGAKLKVFSNSYRQQRS